MMNNGIVREKLLHIYVQALDRGDLDQVSKILDLALTDHDLSRAISQIDEAYEAEIPFLDEMHDDKTLVEQILADIKPRYGSLTVADVVRQLQDTLQLSTEDREASKYLASSLVPLPSPLSAKAIQELAERLNVKVSSNFWDVFRNAAITLSMRHTQPTHMLLAARQRSTRKRSSKDDPNDR